MAKIISEKTKVLQGLRKAADVVGSTMGAHGKYVALSGRETNFTKDGITVASAINLEDPIENIGAEMVVNSARKTVEECGDGTSATSILLKAFTELEEPENVRNFLEKVENEVEEVISKILKENTELTTTEQIRAIATTSGNNEKVGELMKEVYDDVGMDSLVLFQEDEDANETYYEISKGVEFTGDTGYISDRFKTERNGYCIFEDAVVLIDDNKTSNSAFYKDKIKKALELDLPLVFISPAFSREVISLVFGNHSKGLKVCLVKSPGFGRNTKENYKDIEALKSKTGQVKKIVITPTTFTIFSDEDISNRVQEVKDSLKGYMQPHEVEFAKKRIHKLQGTTATIYVGGVTHKNRKEEYDRIEDAIGACKTAIKYGFVSGSGITLANAGQNSIIQSVCEAPLRQIKKNAGLEFNLKEVDVITKKEVNLIKEGIIDPTYVIINSLNNAFASYKLLLNTEHIIYNEPKQTGFTPGI